MTEFKSWFVQFFHASLFSRIKLTYDEMIEAFDVIGEHGDFVASNAKDMLGQIRKSFPKSARGYYLGEFFIGREGTPVIYITVNPKYGITPSDIEEIGRIAKHVGLADQFDDCSKSNLDGKLCFRIWWN